MANQPSRRTRLATVAILLLVFAAGLLVGMALDRSAQANPPVAAEGPRSERDREEDGDRDDDERDGRRLIVDRVGLSSEQKARVDSIVAFHRERMDQLQAEFREAYNPRYWAIVDSTRTQIKALLDPAQAALYDSLLAENDQRRRDPSKRLRGDDRRINR